MVINQLSHLGTDVLAQRRRVLVVVARPGVDVGQPLRIGEEPRLVRVAVAHEQQIHLGRLVAPDPVIVVVQTRTRQTAEALSRALDLPIAFVEGLREGAPGEKMDQIRERTSELLRQLDDSPLRCLALVSHGAPIRSLLEYTTDQRINLRAHAYDNGNCAPPAAVWHGRRAEGGWVWELAFRPVVGSQ